MQDIFDQNIDRTGTGSVKVDGLATYFGSNDLLAMWVADMDFQVPSCVTRAIRERADHPVYGYTLVIPAVYNAVTRWQKIRHNWEVPPEWIVFTPGIVPALNMAVLVYTDPGDKVLLQSPVYPPFFSSIKENGRTIVNNQLIEKNGKYSIDFDDLEKKLSRGVRMMFFCNPHNPVGRVWSVRDVKRVASLCNKYNVVLVSDEIHSDLLFPGHKHVPATLAGEDSRNMVICNSPSKTFNLAGLTTAYLIIPEQKLRKKIDDFIDNLHIHLNIFGMAALQAAYEEGEEWLEGLLNYLRANRDTVTRFFHDELPEIKPVIPEGTYLMWLDCRNTGKSDLKLKKFFIKEAGIAMNPGPSFGPGGKGFFRMNIASPRSKLLNALDRIDSAWSRQ